MGDKKLALVDHLTELRSRIIKSAIFIILGAVIAYSFVDVIISNIAKPVGRLVFIAPQEAFISNIKVSFFVGLFLASPLVIYQIWRFISSALKINERKYAFIFGPASFIFFISGIAFGYLVIVPIAVRFLLGFSNEFVTPMITIEKYISFAGSLAFIFGIVFQVPLASLFLTKIGMVTPLFLSQKRKHVLVSIFILAAFLTPPDVITQFLMAAPLIILYEIGIIFSRLIYRNPRG